MWKIWTSQKQRAVLLHIRTATSVSGITLSGLPTGAGREDELGGRAEWFQDALQGADQLALHDIQISDCRADDQRRVAGVMDSQAFNHSATLTTATHPEFGLNLTGQRVIH